VATRLALLGDASHAINPLAGQGYNLALGDIMTLMDVINDAGNTGADMGGANVLKTYAMRRWPEVTMMTMATDGLNMLFSFGKRRRRLAGMGMAVANLRPVKALAEKLASGRWFNHG
jgi:2-octaprenyl-6-methoxyphenol hydroxylase